MKNKNKLFMICPDCYLENLIKTNYEGQIYFATALGAVFAPLQESYTESINYIITSENISEIYVVNDIDCRFINSIIENDIGYDTKEEKILNKLFLENSHYIMSQPERNQKSAEMAKLNIQLQINELMEEDFIGSKIETGSLQIKGVLFDRSTLEFNELNISNSVYEPAN